MQRADTQTEGISHPTPSFSLSQTSLVDFTSSVSQPSNLLSSIHSPSTSSNPAGESFSGRLSL